jgi:lysophospholipase L1-like esterase
VTDHTSNRQRAAVAGSVRKVIVLAVILLIVSGAVFLHGLFRRATHAAEYVAMGSSFAAGPGDGRRAAGSFGLCEQSEVNYPHLLARQYGLSLNDVTCSGATTRHVLKGGQWFQPAQVSAVHPGTKLVTITVGGNDVFYLGFLTAWSCANNPSRVPWLVRALELCRVPDEGKIEQAFQALPAQLREIVAEVHRRAPEAHILFVDYTTVLPDSGTCERLPLTSGQADKGRELANRLREITVQIVKETNSELLRASDVTHGHDVCSSNPWVYGFQFPSHLLAFEPVPFHPTAKAMQAIAIAAGQQQNPVGALGFPPKFNSTPNMKTP